MIPHNCLKALVCSLVSLVLVGCQLGGSTVSGKEGYFSWVDEQGRVRYSPIVEAPDEKPTDSPLPPDEEFSAANYPDGEELRRKGYVRDGDGKPYFTWRDADGNVRNTYYQPDTRTDAEKGLVAPPVEASLAKVYLAGDGLVETAPVEGYDPNAFAILGVDETADDYLTRFSRTCCEELDTGNHERWQEGREFGVNLDGDSPVHRFLSGASPYQLVSLPRGNDHGRQLYRLRSYENKGVVVLSVLFLDADLQPVRLVTDLVSEFVPENWHRRGYLETRIPVASGAQEERWMLLFTRSEDLEGQTVVDTRRGPRKIPHVNRGEIGLFIMDSY